VKLLKLRLAAFGPYKDQLELDFNSISDKLLFLITGPTGSGKTSIFDAICFALFGEASGESRESNSLRSHFASPNEETFVELEFSLRDTVYTVYRSPRQEISKTKGSGTTVKVPYAHLKSSKEGFIVGYSEVTKKVEEILGINKKQFRQIVMLPQGEFRKLLEANSKEREEILRNIFKTEEYKLIQDKLKDRAKEIETEIGQHRKILDSHVNNIQVEHQKDLEELISAKDKNYTEIIELLSEENNTDEKIISNLEVESKEIEHIVIELAKEITKSIEINEKFIRKDNLKAEIIELQNQEENIKNKESIVKKIENAQKIKHFDERIKSIKDYINAKYQDLNKATDDSKIQKENLEQIRNELSKVKQENDNLDIYNGNLVLLQDKRKKLIQYLDELENLKQMESNHHNLEQSLENLRNNINKTLEEINSTTQELSKYDNTEERYSQVAIEKMKIDTELTHLKNDQRLLEDIAECLGTLNALNKKYKTSKKKYEDAYNRYNYQLELYLRSQAGILAQLLKENEPCPVCGSTTHPKKAELLEDVLSKEELDELKVELIEKEKEYKKYDNELNKTLSVLEDKKMTYQEDHHVLIEDYFDVEEIYRETYKKITNLQQLETQFVRELKELEDKRKIKKELEEKKKILENDYNTLKAQYEQVTKSFNEVDKQYVVQKNKLNNLKQEIGEYESLQDIDKEINTIKTKIETIKTKFEQLLQREQECKSTIVTLETTIRHLNDEIISNKQELNETEKQFRNKLTEYNFKDYEEYCSIVVLDERLDTFKEEINSYYNKLCNKKQSLQELENQLANLTPVNLELLETRIKENNEKLDGYRNKINYVYAKLQSNKRVLTNIKKTYQNITNKEKEYGVISDLAKVANGDNPQRIAFERYVLAAYFEDIIKAANQRLKKMTHDRYYLDRKDEKGKGRAQQGLDLEVYDYYTGKRRDVSTLSGGEAFMASLALALGLSDVVQSYAGGIQLDTIFIDEGFGTLDPESLDQAINTLISLQKQGRLIGIISHVQELKERIDVKLEVKPSKFGSTARFIY